MFPPPTGTSTSPEQVRELDDSYFSGDPAEYFRCRISGLLAWSQGPSIDSSAGLASEVGKLLVRQEPGDPLPDTRRREIQIAVDAFSVRHHVAETLLRFVEALTRARMADVDDVSFWETLSKSPTNTSDVVKSIRTYFSADDHGADFARWCIPERILRSDQGSAELKQAARVLEAWVGHAEYLLMRDDIHLNASNNKAKHGMSLRARDDLLLTIIRADGLRGDLPTAYELNEPGAFNVLDRPVMEILAKTPPTVQPRADLELSWLRLDSATLLAEASMLTYTLAAFFHVAAQGHLDRYGSDDAIAPYPLLRFGPLPDVMLRNVVTGIRLPVVAPHNGKTSERPAGFALHRTFIPIAELQSRGEYRLEE